MSPKELAEAIGVSESSLRRWVDSGAIATTRTVGGHRRISLPEAVRFIRESGMAVVRPELLGLEEPARAAAPADTAERLFDAMKAGDGEGARRQLMSLYLQGKSIAEICDGPIRLAMEKIGELWQHGTDGILIEHYAVDICLQILGQFRQMVGQPAADAPLAMGGAPEGDPYLLPSTMAAVVLGEAGYRPMNYGPNLPVELLARSAARRQPKLVWLSMSVSGENSKLGKSVDALSRTLAKGGTRLVVGGRHARDLRVPRGADLCIVQSMVELAALGKGLLMAKP